MPFLRRRSPASAFVLLVSGLLVPVLSSCGDDADDGVQPVSVMPGPAGTDPSNGPPASGTVSPPVVVSPTMPDPAFPATGGPNPDGTGVSPVSPPVTAMPVPTSPATVTPPANGGAPNVGGGGTPGVGGRDGGDAGSDTGGGSPIGSVGSPATGSGGGTSGGAGNVAGAGSAGGPAMPRPGFDNPMMTGSGTSGERYETALVSRNDVPFVLITNGWGPGFGSHTVSWEGTSFIIEAMEGSAGSMGQPASYPTVFCGKYSVMQVPACGLPAAIDSLTTLKTGWRWAPNGNEGQYNAAYDIWVGDGTRLQGYLMVWLRDPSNFQPAGSPNMAHQGIEVANVPGTWNVWDGSVNGLPIINWVRAEGADSLEIEFDVLDFLRDADTRGLSYPGTHINAVAVGFEIWEGPVSNLETVDFYVDAQ